MGSPPSPCCHVVAVPYPGRGHINAMLNLCRILAARGDGVAATLVVTEEWLGLLGGAAAAAEAAKDGVRVEAIPNVVPSEHGRAGDMAGFVQAVYTRMEVPFERLLDRLALVAAPPLSAIVADTFVLPWAVNVGERRGLPVCVLSPLAPTMFSVHYHFHRLPAAAAAATADGGDPCLVGSYIPGVKSIRLSDLESTRSNSNKKMLNLILEAYSHVRKAQCLIFTSFYELDSNAMDALRQELPFPVFSVGPCIPYMSLQAAKHHAGEEPYMTWLNSQPACSVLYVSLGSFLSVSPAQLDEIAIGLADSEVRFLWVLRGGDADSARAGDLAGGAGMVVPWTDQLKVLCHPSVGGFFTHSGMNSTMEAVHAGVPMLTLPIAFDQPIVSRLVADEWRIGYGLRGDNDGGGVVGREAIAAAARRLMDSDAAEEAKGMRRRASLMREASRAAAQVGGSSYRDTASLINFISEFRK